MLLIKKHKHLLEQISEIRNNKKKINFIPTMGNLHNGHLNLIRQAQKRTNITLVSIFVNPLQFNNSKDYKTYPRTFNGDKRILMDQGVDILFVPDDNFVPKNSDSFNLGTISKKLCGTDRVGHFEGVATVILRFLNLIEPDNIFLGEKDYQQILVIKKVIKKYKLATRTKIVQTVRDKNMVALSSRNILLKEKFNQAIIIPRMLFKIKNSIERGNFSFKELSEIKNNIQKEFNVYLIYLEVLKESNLKNLNEVYSKCRVFICATISGIRLIDNMSLNGRYRLSKMNVIEKKVR